mmetsp:Transcript_32284/g.30779  ORF Transcript_32284/g.30779 Transcript_32284/m.30779 type:complete len:659 (+) Transcript_32284:169-2145(+)|eukprot:CAMPEP_0119050880 /NCGR_PEP_ID=MMETSP1177-20130426/72415_1 /TAXON_ID=2985 /ORGANISM="Ochromonas sp, Strain CCMP1899" /LENGTH=658 /DNA_ID=CAMNT_0007029825 /DNA_START=110 /DNA_END=2086 /DNA_ORIENTATION=+
MLLSYEGRKSFQQFYDVDCVIGDVEKDMNKKETDTDAEIYEILESLDLDGMKKHIINCIASLIEVTDRVFEMNTEKKLREENKAIVTKNKVFSAAVAMMGQALIKNYSGHYKILEAFPDKNSVDWHPLAWAVALGDTVKEEDVKCLYLGDPLALRRCYLDLDYENCSSIIGYSPAHILCMRTNPSLPLIKFFVEQDPIAFKLSCSSEDPESLGNYPSHPLHLVAEYSESTELLQILLQLDESVIKIKAADYGVPHTPLGILCGRGESSVMTDMIACLVEVDSTVEVIEDAIYNCLSASLESESPGSMSTYTQSVEYKLRLIGMLLLANPEAAQCAKEDLIHQICRYTEGDLFMSLITLFLGMNEDALQHADTDGNLPIHIAAQHQNLIVIDFFLSIYPESVSISNNKGDLPIHYAAQSNTLAIIIHLLNIYPESSPMIGSRSRNILHYAMERSDEEATEIARYIFTRYPDLIHGRNLRGPNDWYERNSGYTPFLLALAHSRFNSALAICQADEQVVMDVVICTEATSTHIYPCAHLSNALHIMAREFGTTFQPVSEGADCFRFLLRLHPQAAGIRNDAGLSPYDCVVHNATLLDATISPYMLRLLLRADTTINLDELHRLNYAERRQAIFIATYVYGSGPEELIWNDEYLRQYIVSFI